MISVSHGVAWLLGGAVLGFAVGCMFIDLTNIARARRAVRELEADFFRDPRPDDVTDRRVN
jgi:hypothetical protein